MSNLSVRIDSHVRVSKDALKRAGVSHKDLARLFVYPNPDFMKTRQMGYSTHAVPRVMTVADDDGSDLLLPRGGVSRVKEWLNAEGVNYVVKNNAVSGTGPKDYAFAAPFELGPDQRMAVKVLLGFKQGLLVGPCASGKTTIALAAIAMAAERTLVIVHTERILATWGRDAEECLHGKASVGFLYGKKKQPGADLVIATVQTLRNILKKDPNFVNAFGCVVLDEAHHCPATTFAETVSAFPALYRWALTATPNRRDGKHVLLYDTFGSESGVNKNGKPSPKAKILMTIKDEDLDRFGRIVPVDVVVVPTDFDFDLNRARQLEADPDWADRDEAAQLHVRNWARSTRFKGPLNTYADMLDAMSRDPHRLARVLEFLLPEIKAKKPALLLADRRESCMALQHWLKRRGIECGRLMGGADKKEQDRTEAALIEGDLLLAVGTTVADEGMNIKPLARGFGCTPTAANPGRFTQQFGRFKRKSEGKADAAFFYFWDHRVRSLRGHARAILNAVKVPHRVWYAEAPGRENWRPLTSSLIAELERRAGSFQ